MVDKFYFKMHAPPSERLFAICDEDILGKTFRGDKAKITVTEGFYKGELVDRDFLGDNLDSFTILNAVGNRIVDLIVELGYARDEDVMVIGGVKHIQVVRAARS